MRTIKNDLRAYGINPAKGRRYENITYVLALIVNILQARAGAYLAQYGLSAVQFNILMLAAYQNQGKGLSQVEISKHLIASASNITKVVEKSVRAGLLTRRTNAHNRRENVVCVTPKGQSLIDAAWPGYDRLLRNLTQKIKPAARRPTETALNHWLLALQQEK